MVCSLRTATQPGQAKPAAALYQPWPVLGRKQWRLLSGNDQLSAVAYGRSTNGAV